MQDVVIEGMSMMTKKDLSTFLCDNTLSHEDLERIQQIRKKSLELGKKSQSSEKYQNDVIDACYKALSCHGGKIVEIGALRGGLSVQLSYLSKQFNRELVIVDISPEFCSETEKHLCEQNLMHENVKIITGTVDDLFHQTDCMLGSPCIIIVDALHTYKGAKIDLCKILSHAPNTPVCVFHDYRLRTDDVQRCLNGLHQHENDVKGAILDVVGCEEVLHPIGNTSDDSEKRLSSFEYNGKGLPEGVILFPRLLDRFSFVLANTFCILRNLEQSEQKLADTQELVGYNMLEQKITDLQMKAALTPVAAMVTGSIIKRAIKKVLAKAIGWYVLPIAESQSNFNRGTIQIMHELKHRISSLEMKCGNKCKMNQ